MPRVELTPLVPPILVGAVFWHGGFARVGGFGAIGRLAVACGCLKVFGEQLFLNHFFLPSGATRRSLVGWAHRKIWAGWTRFLMRMGTQHIVSINTWDHMVPRLDSSPGASTADFDEASTINVVQDAMQQWKIFDASPVLDQVKACMEDALVADQSAEAEAAKAKMIDSVVSAALKHVHIEGRSLTLDDCFVFQCAQERGAYFPNIHWDTEYMAFPDCDAFQIWYMLENDQSTGNMFMAHTPDLQSHDLPARYLMQKDGSVQKVLHNAAPHEECPLRHFKSVDDLDFTFTYLDMKPGDCMVMSKRTLHTSDPRPHVLGETIKRLAMNVRVLIKPADRPTFGIWPHHQYFAMNAKPLKQLEKAIEKHEDGQFVRVNGHKQVKIPSRHFLIAFF